MRPLVDARFAEALSTGISGTSVRVDCDTAPFTFSDPRSDDSRLVSEAQRSGNHFCIIAAFLHHAPARAEARFPCLVQGQAIDTSECRQGTRFAADAPMAGIAQVSTILTIISAKFYEATLCQLQVDATALIECERRALVEKAFRMFHLQEATSPSQVLSPPARESIFATHPTHAARSPIPRPP